MNTKNRTTRLHGCARFGLRQTWALTAGLAAALVVPACAQSRPTAENAAAPKSRIVDITDAPLFTNETPADHLILPSDLPPPYATPGVRNSQNVGPRPSGASLHVPPGFEIDDWADNMPNPRWLQTAPNGDIFAAESQPGIIELLRPAKDGTLATKYDFITGLSQPFGIAFYPVGPNPKYIYVADTDEVMRFPYHNGDTQVSGPAENIMALTPGGYNQHWTRTILFSPDSKRLYIGVGSQANVADGEKPPRACVMVANPDGTNVRVYASGLRNAVGLTTNPVSGQLWAAVNERDELGDKLPPDYVTSVKDGGFYGWPYYYIGKNHDPRMPDRPDLISQVIVPDVLLEAHCAALSIEFYTKHQFPKQYYRDGFVVMHGSWNRSDPSGYKVVRLEMNPDGTTKNHGYQDFIWGWKPVDGNVWGRPVSIAFMNDGTMLVSDDGAGKIWRIKYVGQQ